MFIGRVGRALAILIRCANSLMTKDDLHKLIKRGDAVRRKLNAQIEALTLGYKDKRTNEEMDGYPITKQAWDNVMPVVEYVDGWDYVLDGSKIHNKDLLTS